MRRAMEYAVGSRTRSSLAQHCEDDALVRRRPHARGRVVAPAGHRRPAGRGRGADGRPRHRPGPAHRRPRPLPAPLDRRLASSWSGPPGPTGCAVTAEATTHHFTLTDADVRGLRPGVQGQPAAAHRRRRRRGAGRPGRRHPRRHRHRPRPAHPGGQGAGRSTRRRPGMLGLETALALALTELDLPIEQVLALLSWQPAAHRRPRRPPRRPGRRGPPRQPLRDRPRRHVDRRPGRARPAAAATRPTPAAASPAGSATRSSAANPSSSTARPSDEPCAEARARPGRRDDVRGRGHRRRAARRDRHRRGRVQHRAHRLPGGDHRPVLRRADHHLHLPAHRQLRRDRRPTTRAAGRSAAA